MAAKVIANTLKVFIDNQNQRSLNEIRQFSRFDQECHVKLKAFANAADRLGKFMMIKALDRWYNNATKPIQTIINNQNLSTKVHKTRQLMVVFNAWKQVHHRKLGTYQAKTNSILGLWSRL